MQYKVSEISGALLDAAVAKAEGKAFHLFPNALFAYVDGDDYQPSADWLLAGPIIERERLVLIPPASWTLARGDSDWTAAVGEYFETVHSMDGAQSGPTPLIAAMRAYVASRFGETVELP